MRARSCFASRTSLTSPDSSSSSDSRATGSSYALRIRDGKIAHNAGLFEFPSTTTTKPSGTRSRRRPPCSRNSCWSSARIFRMFPVSANAMSRSLGCTIREYRDKTKHLAPQHPPLTAHPKLARTAATNSWHAPGASRAQRTDPADPHCCRRHGSGRPARRGNFPGQFPGEAAFRFTFAIPGNRS